MKMEEKITIQKKNEILNGLVVALKLQVFQLENKLKTINEKGCVHVGDMSRNGSKINI